MSCPGSDIEPPRRAPYLTAQIRPYSLSGREIAVVPCQWNLLETSPLKLAGELPSRVLRRALHGEVSQWKHSAPKLPGGRGASGSCCLLGAHWELAAEKLPVLQEWGAGESMGVL